MKPGEKIYVAGHRGLVGSALVRGLIQKGFDNLVLRTHQELDLMDEPATRRVFEQERPAYVFLAAGKVGGIGANSALPAEFIHHNLSIQTNVVHNSYRVGVKRLLFMGSSCIYPRLCPQPIKEEYLLSGALEVTNRANAVAKIAGIEMCDAYNRQYGTKFLAVMPTNLYGPGDNYDLEQSHVVPALIAKMHQAKIRGETKVVLWGTGGPYRELLYSDDLADACVFLMTLPELRFQALVGDPSRQPLINVGTGQDMKICDLAELVRKVVGYRGKVTFDPSRPDGTPRKLLDISCLHALGWRAQTPLHVGLELAYKDFLAQLEGATQATSQDAAASGSAASLSRGPGWRAE